MIDRRYTTVDENTKNKIREQFKVDVFSIKRDIQIIKDWIKQQQHLPQGTQDDDFIEKCLVTSKFRVEKTKQNLEKYYNFKRIYEEPLRDVQAPLPSKTNLILPLPYLNDNLERIIILNVNNNFTHDDDYLKKYFKHCVCVSEYRLRWDYSVGQRVIQDCSDLTLEQLKKYGIALVKYGRILEAYFVRLAGVEYINAPPFADFVLGGLKTILGEKIIKKITLHKDLESLHKNVNKAYLPKEFGGDLQPLNEFVEMWDKEFESNVMNLEKIIKTEKSNEDLRIGEVKYNEVFGVDGSFKKLCVD